MKKTRVSGKWKKFDGSTKGYELDGVLTQIFGAGANVFIAVNKTTKEFIATDKEVGRLPFGYELFSAGRVGVKSELCK